MKYILIFALSGLCASIIVQESRSQDMAQVEVGIKYLQSTDSLFIEVPSYSGRYRIEARDLDIPGSPWVTMVEDTSLNQHESNFTEVSPLFPVKGNMIFRVYHEDSGISSRSFQKTGQPPQVIVVFQADQKPGSQYFNQQRDLGVSDPVERESPNKIITESREGVHQVPEMTLCRDGHIIHWFRPAYGIYRIINNTESDDRFIPGAFFECTDEHGGYIVEPGFIIPLSL